MKENVIVLTQDMMPEKHIVGHVMHPVLLVSDLTQKIVPHAKDNSTISKIKKKKQVLVVVTLVVKLVMVYYQANVSLVMRMITELSEKMENVGAQKDSLISKTNLHVPPAINSVKLVSEKVNTNVQAVRKNITENQLRAHVLAEINLLPTKLYQVEF